jgi:tetratricopeptide (TPR) repeat protein
VDGRRDDLEPGRTKTYSTELASDSAPPITGDHGAVEVGSFIGRFEVVRALGQGGMGQVVLARDPDLGRDVALKLLRPGTHSVKQQERLLREARSMARLSHPNIVTVYDVGRHDDQIWVAMEYIEGQTLARRISSTGKPWHEVRDLFIDAARGLEAAHEMGIVHRDFKPDNVLIDGSGRAHVADFGLASSDGHVVSDDPEDPSSPAHHRLTRTGSVMGTPRYMAPEQHRGEQVTAAADQFAFCVSLYSALYGAAPFGGDSVPELAESVTNGKLVSRDRPAGVPDWLNEIVLRGLSVEPDDRHESMTALREALEADPRAARRRRMVVAASLGATALVAGLVVFLLVRGGGSVCPKVAGIPSWNDDARGAIRASFTATKRPDADKTADRVIRRLDRFSASWAAARTETCRATHVDGAQSEELLDVRMACLDRVALEMKNLVSAFSSVDSGIINRAVIAVAGLTRPHACATVVPGSPLPAAAEVRQKVSAVEARLAEVRAMRLLGKDKKAQKIIEDVVAEARATGYDPLIAAASMIRGEINVILGKLDVAEKSYLEATKVATRSRQDSIAARAWMGLIDVAAHRPKDSKALEWLELAEAAVVRAGNSNELQFHLQNARGRLFARRSDHKKAVPAFRRALELLLAQDKPDPYQLAAARQRLGQQLVVMGKPKEGLAQADKALAEGQRALGEGHPMLARVHEARADALLAMQRFKEGVAASRAALSIIEGSRGPKHPRMASSLISLGIGLGELGKYKESIDAYKRAAEVLAAAYGADSVEVAMPIHNAGVMYRALEKNEEAREYLERALKLRKENLPADHLDLVLSYSELGSLAEGEGHYDLALDNYRRALAIDKKRLGPDHLSVATDLRLIADALDKLRRYDEAERYYKESLAIAEKRKSPFSEGAALINWAEMLAKRGRHVRAKALFVRALPKWEKLMGPDHHYIAHIVVGLGRAELALGKPKKAVPLLERGLKLRTSKQVSPSLLAATQILLSHALVRAGGDRKRARSLALAALDYFRRAGKAHAKNRAEAEAWLARLR